ncbi:hypothetical protein [Acinetobacter sp. ABJ_C5_2]|uniref:hypothetical protein n=1 Tax=Acinetobacter sp. ABJ_C5_2 TaxID=3376992 RepID=UPI0037CBABC9
MYKSTRTNAFLVSIKNIINNLYSEGNPLDVHVTLVVSGQIITGNIVSEEEYFNHELTSTWKQVYDEVIKKPRDEFNNLPDEEYDSKEVPEYLLQNYLFLKNAYYVNGDKFIPSSNNDGIPIQVRIADITAFNFGSLNISKT